MKNRACVALREAAALICVGAYWFVWFGWISGGLPLFSGSDVSLFFFFAASGVVMSIGFVGFWNETRKILRLEPVRFRRSLLRIPFRKKGNPPT